MDYFLTFSYGILKPQTFIFFNFPGLTQVNLCDLGLSPLAWSIPGPGFITMLYYASPQKTLFFAINIFFAFDFF
jgi:hypothetical protein